MPIVDAHHHLFGDRQARVHYELDELRRDLSSGHRIIGTVYVEAYGSGWRTDGPDDLRSVGEIEKIVGLTRASVRLASGDCQIAAGIVSNVDLRLGDRLEAVLSAHREAAEGRLSGVRQHTAYVTGEVGKTILQPPPAQLMADRAYRDGVRRLPRLDLALDVTAYHTQLAEVIDLARDCAETSIVLDHIATPIGVAEFSAQREEVFAQWQRGMAQLAELPNVTVKLGGMGMAVMGFGFEHEPAPARADRLAAAWAPHLDFCLEHFGTQRLFLESNFPVDRNAASYAEIWNAFKRATASLSQDERRDLFYRTASRVYRLSGLLEAVDAGRV